jgi:alpha-D-ribose 1-methylphosphonate 5-triphosphate synthase subunit PhnI
VGYSGVKGGMDAILAAERLVRRKRAAAPWAAATAIVESYRLAVDRVMGEAGLYDEAIAADAFRQAEGDLIEAAHLVRAYRSALPRLAVSTPADPGEMTVLRRIVPASRTPGGPQLLGRTTDYTARVLERPQGPAPAPDEPAREEPAQAATRPALADPGQASPGQASPGQASPGQASPGQASPGQADPGHASPGHASSASAAPGRPRPERADPRRPRRFYEQLLKAGLVVDHGAVDHGAVDHGAVDHGAGAQGGPADDPEPFDVSRGAARPPAPRSAVLASMARAETGALVALWYRSIRGPDGAFHEVTLGELRHGRLPVRVVHPLTGHPVEIGQVRATEAEAIEDLDGPAEDRTRLDVGYGLCFGHNERKAIAMASLDIAYRRAAGSASAGRERRIYAVPPHTSVTPLTFDDVPFEVEHVPGGRCAYCGSDDTFLVEAAGGRLACSDSDWCTRSLAGDTDAAAHRARAPLAVRPGPSRPSRPPAKSRSSSRTGAAYPPPSRPGRPRTGALRR